MSTENSPDIKNEEDSSNADYFTSYANLGVHELMLKDKPRTLAYKQFIETNVNLLRDKVVLDVGAGSGILSLFAAKAGAKKVYAIEASEIAEVCKEIVKINKYENVVTVIKGMVEKVELPEKVDVIISEWMGFYLLHESMLDSVLCARDKWLKEDGILLPSHANIYACPVNMDDYCMENFEYWKDVYGFDFSPFFDNSVATALRQPAVTMLKPSQCLAEPQVLAKFDLKTVKLLEAQEIVERFATEINTDSTLHGFATWFDVEFAPNINPNISDTLSSVNTDTCNGTPENDINSCDNKINTAKSTVNKITLSTSPVAPETHWKQTVCFLPMSVSVTKEDTIFCKMMLCQSDENKRHFNMSLQMLESLEDTDDDDSDINEDDDEGSEIDHPMPCDCGAGRCALIRAIMEKYDQEQTELEMEAEFTDVTAEMQAAESLDNDSSYLDSEGLTNDDSNAKDE